MRKCLVSDTNYILSLYIILCISFTYSPIDSKIFWNIFFWCFQSLFFLRMQDDIWYLYEMSENMEVCILCLSVKWNKFNDSDIAMP